MNVQSNSYTVIYAAVLVIIVALGLSYTSVSLKDKQQLNRDQEKKQMILKAIGIHCTREEAVELFPKYVYSIEVLDYEGKHLKNSDGFKIDLKQEYSKPQKDRLYPAYRTKVDNKEICVFPVYGKGLWGPIWGYVALEDDYNTIFNVVFDHQSETPGLGAEITTDQFQKQFVGKKIFDQMNNFVSILVNKPGKGDPTNPHQVDGISGSTLTSKGLEDMLKNSLQPYVHCFTEMQKQKNN